MMKIEANYYDGKTSLQHKVVISTEAPDSLRVSGEGINYSYSVAAVKVSSRVGNTKRRLYFSDGSLCETADNDAIDKLFGDAHIHVFNRVLHLWENHYGYVLTALVLTIISLWGGVNYGIPILAKQIAFNLPPVTERILGQGVLDGLDDSFLEPSQLSVERQEDIRKLFLEMKSQIPGATNYSIELRASDVMGANALALPAGIVLVTDALVDLTLSEDELTAVLAHEIGHLNQRHSLRQLLQNSGLILVWIAITGDIGAVNSFAVALPSLLVALKYSQDLEREADAASFAYLRQHNIPTNTLSEFLLRLEKEADIIENLPEFLSTHPASRDRVDQE